MSKNKALLNENAFSILTTLTQTLIQTNSTIMSLSNYVLYCADVDTIEFGIETDKSPRITSGDTADILNTVTMHLILNINAILSLDSSISKKDLLDLLGYIEHYKNALKVNIETICSVSMDIMRTSKKESEESIYNLISDNISIFEKEYTVLKTTITEILNLDV